MRLKIRILAVPTAHTGFDSISHRLVIQHALLLLQAAALPSGHPSVFKGLLLHQLFLSCYFYFFFFAKPCLKSTFY